MNNHLFRFVGRNLAGNQENHKTTTDKTHSSRLWQSNLISISAKNLDFISRRELVIAVFNE